MRRTAKSQTVAESARKQTSSATMARKAAGARKRATELMERMADLDDASLGALYAVVLHEMIHHHQVPILTVGEATAMWMDRCPRCGADRPDSATP